MKLYKNQYLIKIYDNQMNEENDDMNDLYIENAIEINEKNISKK
jgi:hypothetical protein